MKFVGRLVCGLSLGFGFRFLRKAKAFAGPQSGAEGRPCVTIFGSAGWSASLRYQGLTPGASFGGFFEAHTIS